MAPGSLPSVARASPRERRLSRLDNPRCRKPVRRVHHRSDATATHPTRARPGHGATRSALAGGSGTLMRTDPEGEPGRRWVVNGKFLARRATGTERFARSLLVALDEALPETADWTLLHPQGAEPPPLRRIRARAVGRAGVPLHLWEQLSLPVAARDALLLNLAGSASWLAASRSVSVIHDAAVFDHPAAYTGPFGAWYRHLFRRLARRAAGVATVSTFSRDRLSRALGTPPGRWRVLAEGADHLDAVAADPAALARLGLAPGRYLLAVASANPTKNLARLIEAFAALPPDGAVALVLVGGRNDAAFADEAARADPPGVVRAGPVDDATLKALYLGAAALVFPSLYEGFGLPPVEAMSLGCPVVAARAASLPEVCGDAALYVDPTSVESIAEGMRRVLADAALRERLAAAGRARVATMTWRAAAERLLAALDDLPLS
jgi:glycosyltransferase involved in cell wall biosynthesis